MEVLVGLASPEVNPLGVQTAAFSMCPYMAFPPCPHTPGVSLCVPMSPPCKDTSQTGSGLTLRASFYLNYLFKDPVSEYGHILRH